MSLLYIYYYGVIISLNKAAHLLNAGGSKSHSCAPLLNINLFSERLPSA